LREYNRLAAHESSLVGRADSNIGRAFVETLPCAMALYPDEMQLAAADPRLIRRVQALFIGVRLGCH